MSETKWLLDNFLAIPLRPSALHCLGLQVALCLSADKRSERYTGLEVVRFPLEKSVPNQIELRWIIAFLRLKRIEGKKVLLLEGRKKGAGRIIAASFLFADGHSLRQVFSWGRRHWIEPFKPEEVRLLSEIAGIFQKDATPEEELFRLFIQTMRLLRRRCPWDRKQTHKSLTKYLIEESWELAAAVEKKNPQSICEELGDVLLQVFFHTAIAEEKGQFQAEDVLAGITEKLMRRHPHVFGSSRESTSRGVLAQWQTLKGREGSSQEDRLRRYMPALLRAERLQEEASQRGMDWENINGVWEKVQEEMGELEKTLAAKDKKQIVAEFGDLLFALVNLSRFLNLNPEKALHDATDKFWHRTQRIMQKAVSTGKDSHHLSAKELDELWHEVKKEEH